MKHLYARFILFLIRPALQLRNDIADQRVREKIPEMAEKSLRSLNRNPQIRATSDDRWSL